MKTNKENMSHSQIQIHELHFNKAKKLIDRYGRGVAINMVNFEIDSIEAKIINNPESEKLKFELGYWQEVRSNLSPFDKKIADRFYRENGFDIDKVIKKYQGESAYLHEDDAIAFAKECLAHFGHDSQHLKLIEEMSELMQAILKGTNVSEEIADVQIVLNQLKLLYPDWISWEQVKLKRLTFCS